MFEQNTLEEICESVEERLTTELPQIIIALNRAGKQEADTAGRESLNGGMYHAQQRKDIITQSEPV